ncbi:MAG: CYTH domain-containing protein [Ilumatobacteraceae bacterium]
MTTEHREVERKFEAPDGTPLPARLGEMSVGDAEELHLVATYHDTASLRLLGEGTTLRYRTGEGDADGWHLKLPAGADARREVHVAGGPDALPDEVLQAVQHIAGSEAVTPVAELCTTRVERAITDAGGRRVAVLDDDTVVGRRVSDGVVVAWHELEAELAPGVDDALLEEIADALHAAGWTAASPLAKVARVLHHGQ